jgi:hypothetical protein
MTFRPYDEVIEILRATHDGDDLSPLDLKLTELAINGFLSEKGVEAFNALLANVRAGYKPTPPPAAPPA